MSAELSIGKRVRRLPFGYRCDAGESTASEALRFTLSLRDVEDLLAERGIMVSYETVRRWVNYFGPMIATALSH